MTAYDDTFEALVDMRLDAEKARADEFLERPDPTVEALAGMDLALDALHDLDLTQVPHVDLDKIAGRWLDLYNEIREVRKHLAERRARCVIEEHLGPKEAA